MTAHLLAIQPLGDPRPFAAYADGTSPDDDLPNELIDTPNQPETPDETGLLHDYIESLLSGLEPYEPGPYTGDDNSDPGFYSDDWE